MKFSELYEQYSKLVYNLSLQYLQHVEEAEEITQDVFVSVHRNIQKFEEQSSYSTWIYRITVNKCLDYLKAKKRKKRFAYIQSLFNSEGKFIQVVDECSHPGIQLEHKEAYQALFSAINSLSENQKTVLILHKIEQLPQQRVAEIMGLSPKAVESLVQRAKSNLQKKLNRKKE